MKKTLILAVLTVLSLLISFPASAQKVAEDYSSPLATFKTYMEACKNHDFSIVDRCYTQEFNRFAKSDKNYMAHRHAGQLDNEYAGYADKSVRVESHGRKVILRFTPEDKKTPSLYLVNEDGRWKIDAMFMFNNIIYDQNNEWFWKNNRQNAERIWINK
jgi:hypothetical protein